MYAKPCCGDRGTGKILYAKTGAVSEYTDRKRWLCGVIGRFGQADGLAGKFGQTDGIAGSSGRQIDSVREDMRLQNVRHQREKHWELAVGSEAFVVALQEAGQAEQILILTDTEEEDETHISQYQARSVLFQKIIARYQSIASVGMQMAAVKKQHWIVCTGGNRGSLMAVSALCAWILARRQRVLYVEFSKTVVWYRYFNWSMEPQI